MQTFALALLAAVEPTETPSILGLIYQGLLGLAGLALTALMGVASAAIRSRTKDARFGALINQLWVIVQTGVAHAEAEIRPKLQMALADGVLTPEEGAALKADVMKIIRDTAGTQLGELVKTFGLPEGMLNTLLSGLVERAVSLLKASPEPTLAAPTLPSVAPAIPPVVTPSPQ